MAIQLKTRIQEVNIYAFSYRSFYPKVNIGSACHKYIEAQVDVHWVIDAEQNRDEFLAYCPQFTAVFLGSKYLIVKDMFFLLLPDIDEQTSSNIKVPLLLHRPVDELEAQSIILLEVLAVYLALK